MTEISVLGSVVGGIIGGILIGWSAREYWTNRRKA